MKCPRSKKKGVTAPPPLAHGWADPPHAPRVQQAIKEKSLTTLPIDPHAKDADVVYKIYILRHGIAEHRGGNGIIDDEKRKLTTEGKLKLIKAAKGLLARHLLTKTPAMKNVDDVLSATESFSDRRFKVVTKVN